MPRRQILIAGGGIGGLAAAIASRQAGWGVRLAERASAFSEVGAGVQLGPNAVRCLDAWGLQAPLQAVACFPERLEIRSAINASELGRMRLGRTVAQRYGAAYLTIHRADLHALLLAAVSTMADVELLLDHRLSDLVQDDGAVAARLLRGDGSELALEADLLLGADGLHSRVRELLLGEGAPRPAGHLAYRAVVPQHALPQRLRSQGVTVWLGPQLHVVHYPLRGGELLNLVAIRHGQPPADLVHWDHGANAGELQDALARTCAPLQDMLHAVSDAGGQWRLWPLVERAPVSAAAQMAQGLIALLGDAAHPMRPYLAQGAGMAIEDAAELGHGLGMQALEPALRLRRYALNRWQRVAAVQRRSRRNAGIFHATGPVRVARDAALRLLGERLLDMPWLYGGGPVPIGH